MGSTFIRFTDKSSSVVLFFSPVEFCIQIEDSKRVWMLILTIVTLQTVIVCSKRQIQSSLFMPSHTVSTLTEEVRLVFSKEPRRIMQTLWYSPKKAFNESASRGPAFIKPPPSHFTKQPQGFVGNSCKINSFRLTHLVNLAKFAKGAGQEGCPRKHSLPPGPLQLQSD